MAARATFDSLIRSLVPDLQAAGFRRKGRTFHSLQHGNWAVIEFQKSQKSSAEVVLFTINLGVASTAVLRFDGDEVDSPPPIERCHWSTRIGFILSGNEDTWWRIEGERDLERLRDEVARGLYDVALPKLKSLVSDDALRVHWLTGAADGLTEIQRLRVLSILLKEHGSIEDLKEAVRLMRQLSEGRPTEGFVRGHIQRLGIREA